MFSFKQMNAAGGKGGGGGEQIYFVFFAQFIYSFVFYTLYLYTQQTQARQQANSTRIIFIAFPFNLEIDFAPTVFIAY